MESLLVSLGKSTDGKEVKVDLIKDRIKLILLFGDTGSGKSFFARHLYNQVIEQLPPEKLKLVILDNTKSELSNWNTPYVEVADDLLDIPYFNLYISSEVAISQHLDMMPKDFMQIVHIEECDLAYREKEYFEQFLKLIAGSGKSQVIAVYSTSKPDLVKAIPKWLRDISDIKVVFKTSFPDISNALIGSREASDLKIGEKILVVGDKTTKLTS